MDVSHFTRLFPTLYHLTFAANLEGLRTHGLHSTASLAELHQLLPAERQGTVLERRRAIQTFTSTQGSATLRDQHTATEALMKSCLVQVSIPDWLALLNAKVFFFLELERMQRMKQSYADYPQLLLRTDSRALLERYAEHVSLSRINTGSFIRRPTPRGRNSFIPLADYAFKKKRDTPAELTLDCALPDVLAMSTFELLSPETKVPEIYLDPGQTGPRGD